MAGGKESPRQKMIGMMYLVLTALLALQIKDSVLEKFVLMESGLEVSNSSFLDYNQTILSDIKADVVNQGDKSGDQAVAAVAQGVRDYTKFRYNPSQDSEHFLWYAQLSHGRERWLKKTVASWIERNNEIKSSLAQLFCLFGIALQITFKVCHMTQSLDLFQWERLGKGQSLLISQSGI